eukprot:TRINITY_DN7119_c0_g1_i1.p1 TRINITY_DN7119_c0_g1~~TRINITY_DN7119_c0_g1_i1.p1  ORF type:complete len:233 (+),score=6.04 TRINITY_DN7119_c0_g1_i1:256-954(+)
MTGRIEPPLKYFADPSRPSPLPPSRPSPDPRLKGAGESGSESESGGRAGPGRPRDSEQLARPAAKKTLSKPFPSPLLFSAQHQRGCRESSPPTFLSFPSDPPLPPTVTKTHCPNRCRVSPGERRTRSPTAPTASDSPLEETPHKKARTQEDKEEKTPQKTTTTTTKRTKRKEVITQYARRTVYQTIAPVRAVPGCVPGSETMRCEGDEEVIPMTTMTFDDDRPTPPRRASLS